jgi:phosphate-selective porin OprO and OprP
LFRTARFFAFALLLAAIPEGLRAQAPPAGTTPAFVLESDNGDNRIQFGGLLQIDGRFAADGGDRPGASTFFVRRLRAVTQGRLARHVEFYVNVDFAGNATHVRDAYFDTRLADAIRIRVGKFKAPFSYDRLVPAAHLLFVERSFTTAIAADRDVGLQLLGDLPGGRVSYGLALTNGAPDGGTGDTDADSSKDVTARLVVRPVAASSSRPWSGLRVALALNSGQSTTQLPSFQTTARQPFFAYQGATGDGRRTRWSPQVIYVSGPLWAYGEYVHSRGGVRRDDDVATVDHEAWVVGGSWVLTGEPLGRRPADSPGPCAPRQPASACLCRPLVHPGRSSNHIRRELVLEPFPQVEPQLRTHDLRQCRQPSSAR